MNTLQHYIHGQWVASAVQGPRFEVVNPATEGVVALIDMGGEAEANAAVAAAISTTAVQERMISEGLTPVGSRPEAYADFLRSEHDKWTRVIKQAGLTRQ